MARKTKEEFIKRALLTHGDKYDYSKVLYLSNKTKVCIICHKLDKNGEEHGEFWLTPGDHYRYGCPKCGKERSADKHRLTTNEFIERAIKVHGNKYNYDKVIYKGALNKIIITCPIHGDFELIPSSHLEGSGCLKCSNSYVPTTEEWIKKAKLVHNNKYDYSKVKYINAHTKVIITCPIHGDFYLGPNNHLLGSGCPECGKLSISEKNKYDKEIFISKAKEIYKDRYNYDKVEYIRHDSPVIITCPIHGDFKQRPDYLLRGRGCPLCNETFSKGESLIREYLEDSNINYILQYLILIDSNINPSNNAYIDFYLPDYNIFIEYNGQQHYEYIPFFHLGGIIDFERLKKRDEYVRKYCKNNRIHLLEIKYNDDISECLNEFMLNITGNYD